MYIFSKVITSNVVNDDVIFFFVGFFLFMVPVDITRVQNLLQLRNLLALVIFNFEVRVRFRSLFLSLPEPLDEGGGLVMDLLRQLLGHILLGHLLGPLNDDFFVKNVLFIELIEDKMNLGKKGGLIGVNSFLNPPDQIFLTFSPVKRRSSSAFFLICFSLNILSLKRSSQRTKGALFLISSL